MASSIALPVEPPRGGLVLAEVLSALAEPLRLDYVAALDAGGEAVCGDAFPGLAKSTLSHHFNALRRAGVITSRRQGKTILNAVRRADLDARFPGLLDAVLRGRDGGGPAEAGEIR